MTKTFKKSVAFLSAAVMVMAMLLYFPSGTFSNIDFGITVFAEENGYDNGFCTEYEQNGSCTNTNHANCNGYQPATLTNDKHDIDGVEGFDEVYEISNAGQLYWFAALVNGTLNGVTQNTAANAVLTADITVNTSVLNNSGELNTANIENFTIWTPIGNKESNQYTGTFDGRGHTISGLYFNDTGTDYVGLFGYVGNVKDDNGYVTSAGKVSNVGVVDSYFEGKYLVGGVCGKNAMGKITYCYNKGAVSGTEYVGGVCGQSRADTGRSTTTATITNCYNTGAVSGTGNYVGGVCGQSCADTGQGPAKATITNCYNTGAVSGTGNYVGGVCGINNAAQYVTATIENCHNTGNVSGSKDVGGVCGFNNAASDETSTSTAKITNCYNTGTVDGSNDVGGVCGWNENGTITDCYNNTGEVRGSGSVGGVCGKNYAVNTFGTAAVKATITNCHNTGEVRGSGNDVGGVCGINDAAHYGTATIENCYNTESVTGGENVGGVCGYNNAASETSTSTATITNCHNTGSVTGTGYYVGGVCGENYASPSDTATIINCYNTGEVSSSKNYVGGVCGYNNAFPNGKATITNCYNRGTVSGLGSGSGSGNYIGGVCGYNVASDETSKATITNCYNTGAVSGSSNVGGVCGWIDGGTISNCYNTASVTGSYAGGVCGLNWVEPSKTATVTITNCYYLNDTADKGIGLCKDEDEGSALASAKSKTSEDFSEGEVCYLLNNCKTDGSQVWYQTLDSGTKEAYPNLDTTNKESRTVYACTPCTGVFSNTSGQHAEHSYVVDTNDSTNHICKNCGIDSHDAVFTANDTTDTISVCCDLGSVTLKAPTENLTYDGTEKAATVTGNIEGFDRPDIVYDGNSTTAPKDAGEHTASITYTIGGTNHSVSVEYTIKQADPDVTVDTEQNVVCGVGTFTEPDVKGVDGNTLAGTFTYDSKSYADTVESLKTKANGTTGNINYTFTPDDTINYSTATGTINCTMVDVAFMVGDEEATAANAVTIKANPTYGDSWADILTLKAGLKAVLLDETVTTGFSFAIDGVSDTSVKPNAGNYTYNVLFNGKIGGKTFTDHVVATGTVDVAKKELTVSAGTYKVSKVYDGKTEKGTGSGELKISGIINNDNVTVNTGTIGEYSNSDVGNDYKVAVDISLDGTAKDNYTLGDVTSINVPAEITKAEQTADVIDPVVEKFDCCSVTLTEVPGYEYSMDGTTWQESCVFTGLTDGETYKFYQRIKATANYEASAASGLLDYQFNAAEHDYTAKTVKSAALYKSATCTSPAVYYYSCSKCGAVENDTEHTFTSGSALGHSLVSAGGYKAPTCSTAGKYANRKCSRCSYYVTGSTIPATGKHVYSAETVKETALISEATCSSPAMYHKSCETCGLVSTSDTDVFTDGDALAHDYSSGGICKTCENLKNGRDGFKSASVTLTDGVIINYNLLLSDEALADTKAYVNFTSPQGLDVKIMLSKGVKENDRYKFSLKLRPDQMADLITAQVVYSNGSLGNSIDYSVQDYVEAVDNSGSSEVVKNLADAMLNFGAFTQLYTGENSDNLAADVTDYTVNASIGDEYKHKLTSNISDITVKGAALQIGAYTTIRVKYQLAEGAKIEDFTFKCGETVLEPEKSGDYYYVYLRNIRPQNLDEMYSFTVSDGTNTTTLEYSPFSYMKTILDNPTAYNKNIVNLMNAMYDYNKAAKAYNN